MLTHMRAAAFFAALYGCLGPFASAAAQNTSGVSGPVVKPGDRSIEYRLAISPEDDGAPSSIAQRLHYQQSITDSWRARIIAVTTKKAGQDFNLRAVQLETLWQFADHEADGWDSGLLTNLNIPIDDGKPWRLRFGWTNQVDLDERWQARGIAYVAREFGENSRGGFILETREEATYDVGGGTRVGAQMFNSYGTTANFGPFDSQNHQLGPVVKGKLGRSVSYNVGALFGLSRAASDVDVRLFLGYSF